MNMITPLNTLALSIDCTRVGIVCVTKRASLMIVTGIAAVVATTFPTAPE